MIINGSEIKAKSKDSISKTSPNPMVTTTIVMLISGIATSITNIGQEKEKFFFIILGFILSLVYGFISVGYQWYCLNVARNQSPDPISILEIFSNKMFVKVLILSLLVYVRVLLWSLLFIIPGIIKSYSYSQSMYVQYDHPDWTASQCIEESKQMMNGYKAELFVFQLSFIGWALLTWLIAGIVGGILGIFLPSAVISVVITLATVPLVTYMSVSNANFYNVLFLDRYNQQY